VRRRRAVRSPRPPRGHDRAAADEGERDVRVADVDGEEHARIIRVASRASVAQSPAMGPRRSTGGPPRVAIVGGGASGALGAANRLREGPPGLRVTVYEPRAELGLGVAYSTREPWHRLNVPATGMSAVPGDPDHFRAWAGAAPEAFLPRLAYGRYLRQVLADAIAGSAASL